MSSGQRFPRLDELIDQAQLVGPDGLDRVARGQAQLLDEIGAYEEQMRQTAYPILRMTLDHDTNFGGGGLARARGAGKSS